MHRDDGNPSFWTVVDGFLQLSFFCNWRFLNLNKAFEVVVGASARSMFVYSDMGGSGVVGNQVTNLLCSVTKLKLKVGSRIKIDLIVFIPCKLNVSAALKKTGESSLVVVLCYDKFCFRDSVKLLLVS